MLIPGDGGGDGGGKNELLLGVFLTFRGALGLYGSLGCVSKAALTVELADKITIFLKLLFFFFPSTKLFVRFDSGNDKAVTVHLYTWRIIIRLLALRFMRPPSSSK